MMKQNELWGITTYFNPEKYKSKYKNYVKFRESSKKQGLKLIVVECAFGDEPFELSQKDAEKVVQVRCNSILWQKERLLNVALKHLPDECTKVAWLDADILFLNENWVEDTSKLLDTYKVVQLFDTVVRLKKNQKFSTLCNFKNGTKNGEKREGYVYSKLMNLHLKYKCSPGFAWAIQREIIEKIGFYDLMILGGGDGVLVQGFLGLDSGYSAEEVDNHVLEKSRTLWIEKAYEIIKADVYYVSGIILHLFHGEIDKRMYGKRYKMIKNINFDIHHDLYISPEGCFEWNNQNSEINDVIKKYFLLRNEDGFLNWESYLRHRPDLYKNWNGPVRATIHYFLFNSFVDRIIKTSVNSFFNNLIDSLRSFLYQIWYKNDLKKIEKIFLNGFDDITVVIGVKNKSLFYLKNALKSIRNQDYPQFLIKIIVVDYSSRKSIKTEYQKLCSDYDAQYFYTKNMEIWNRSHCLNIGIKKTKTKFILCSDVDIIFEKNYIKETIRALKQDPKQFVFSQMNDSPENLITENTDIVKEYENIKNQCKYRGEIKNNFKYKYGSSIICVYTCFFKFIHGYDEFYKIWGCEDDDLIKRFRFLGLKEKNITHLTSHIHQWHESSVDLTNTSDKVQFLKNQKYLNSNNSIIRNKKDWGVFNVDNDVHLITCVSVDYDYSYLKHFIEYYKQFKIKSFTFILHTNQDNETMIKKSKDLINSHLDSSEILIWKGDFYPEKKAEKINLFIDKNYLDWNLVVDIDEFVEFKNNSIQDTLLNHNKEVVWGKFVDRIAADKSIREIKNEPSIFIQFPKIVNYSKLINAKTSKPVLFRAQYLDKFLHSTNQNTCSFFSNKIKINHFKWTKSTKEKLEKREKDYRQRGYYWYKESQKALYKFFTDKEM